MESVGLGRQPRRMGASYPRTDNEWDLRPYFLSGEDRSWRELREDLRSTDGQRRRRSLEQLLNGARWDDIWRLVDVDTVARELPRLCLDLHETWREFIRVAARA